MSYIRMVDFPMVHEVRNEYKSRRQNGASRAEAVEMLKDSYRAELTEGKEDDAHLFWIGLAEGQCHYQELTAEVADEALAALAVLEQYDWHLSMKDIQKRREMYSQAPMPEKAKIRKSTKFRCKWNIGDTFAYQLKGAEVAECGLEGMSLLLRKVDEMEFHDGRIYPVVMLSVCPSNRLPVNTEEYNQYPLLMLENRRSMEPRYFEFRAELLVGSTRTLNQYDLKYVGNFADGQMPEDEVVMQAWGMTYMLPIQCLDMYACIFWRKQPMFLDILKSIQD